MSMEPMDLVRQTGKTIIFEEFNKEPGLEVDSLLTLLTRDDEEISLQKFRNELMGKKESGENADLVVESFEEFVRKFAPTVYETVFLSENGETRFAYTLEKPKYDCREIRLKDHAFYRMIMRLMDRKADTDKGNLEFPYDDLKKALTPESEMAEYKQLRKNLNSNWKQYQRLMEKGEPGAELERFTRNVEANLDKIAANYMNNSPLALLPLMIADTQAKIQMLRLDGEDRGSGVQAPAPCELFLDQQGNLAARLPESSQPVLLEQSCSDDAESFAPGAGSEGLIALIREDFQELAPPRFQGNDYVRDLVVSVFAPEGSAQPPQPEDLARLEAVKKTCQELYKNSLESFAEAVARVVEKFAGMRAFFDHAAYRGELARDVSVIIANCRADAILNDERAKERFLKYFRALSMEKDVNRIWFGVIPAVSPARETAAAAGAPRRERRLGLSAAPRRPVPPVPDAAVSVDSAKSMLKLLAEVKIMTFLNCKACEETGFVELTKKRVQEYMREFDINSEYAVFAYPNFTILPREKSAVKIGTEFDGERGQEVSKYLTVPGVYLDAAYVAAGLTAGLQNYELLQSLGYEVNPKYPCVRFDLEEGDNAKRVLTKLNRETTTEMLKETKDAIVQDRFGFAFADNKIVYDGRVLTNSYVLNARTLKRGENGGKYTSIYKTLVRNLVDQILRSLGDYVTEARIREFLSIYAGTWREDNKDKDRKYANRILMEGEHIELDPEKRKLVLHFNKEEAVWSEIVIEAADAEGKE